MFSQKEKNTLLIKKLAHNFGFENCNIAKVAFLKDDALRLEKYLSKGYQGEMDYLERNIDLRLDPSKLFPGAKSIVVFSMNYFQENPYEIDGLKISRYALGKDYHKVIKKKLKLLYNQLKTEIGDFAARGFVDSAPILEKSWAVNSGLGFIGKNGNLIVPKQGSYFFLATLICDLDLIYDAPFASDHCGTCTQCIDACPTQAIKPNKEINGSQCISYFTIETKNNNWESQNPNLENWMFGCDVCQVVCPWNRFSTKTKNNDFQPLDIFGNLKSKSDWENLNEEKFNVNFAQSPLKRKGLEGIKKTIKYLK